MRTAVGFIYGFFQHLQGFTHFFCKTPQKNPDFFSGQGCFLGSEKTPLRVRGLVNFWARTNGQIAINCCKYCTFGTFNGFFVRNQQLKKRCNFFYLSILVKRRRRKASQGQVFPFFCLFSRYLYRGCWRFFVGHGFSETVVWPAEVWSCGCFSAERLRLVHLSRITWCGSKRR